MMENNKDIKLLNEKEVAEIFRIARQTVANWRFEGKSLRYHKIGRDVRYSLADVEEYIKAARINLEHR
jgi:excisionase family DNA binding protein